MSSRMAAQYCPYCGEQDLRPTETDGQWECRDCIRVFGVRFVGISAQALSTIARPRAATEQKEGPND